MIYVELDLVKINSVPHSEVYTTDQEIDYLRPYYIYSPSDVKYYQWNIGNLTYSNSSFWNISNLPVGEYEVSHYASTDNLMWNYFDFSFAITERPTGYLEEYPIGDSPRGTTLTFSGFGTDDGSIEGYRWVTSTGTTSAPTIISRLRLFQMGHIQSASKCKTIMEFGVIQPTVLS